jgi:hypothetical protein
MSCDRSQLVYDAFSKLRLSDALYSCGFLSLAEIKARSEFDLLRGDRQPDRCADNGNQAIGGGDCLG